MNKYAQFYNEEGKFLYKKWLLYIRNERNDAKILREMDERKIAVL